LERGEGGGGGTYSKDEEFTDRSHYFLAGHGDFACSGDCFRNVFSEFDSIFHKFLKERNLTFEKGVHGGVRYLDGLSYGMRDGELNHVILSVSNDEDIVVYSWRISCGHKIIKRLVFSTFDG
jgi:hypothetical protein